jgi:hypothetical protein
LPQTGTIGRFSPQGQIAELRGKDEQDPDTNRNRPPATQSENKHLTEENFTAHNRPNQDRDQPLGEAIELEHTYDARWTCSLCQTCQHKYCTDNSWEYLNHTPPKVRVALSMLVSLPQNRFIGTG